MDELPPGSQWDILMEALLADDGYLKVSDFQYHSELSTIGFLDRSPMVSGMQAHWLSTSNEPRERTASRSTHYRNIGNDYHNNNADPDNLAANYFTKAVFSAPSKSIELAYAHANRAAALCRKSEFADEGYWDCELAIKYNYPRDKLFKLLQRKLMFGYVSKRVNRISETLKQLEDLVATQKIVASKNFNLENEKQKFTEFVQCLKAAESKASVSADVENKKLSVISQQERGRYVQARESIKTDAVIFREKAFAFVPVYNDYRKDAISYHCQNCAKTNCIPFPCNECSCASYCSPKCCIEHKSIHKYECDGYRKDLWIKIGIAHLAMRNLLVGFPTLLPRLKHLRNASIFEVWLHALSDIAGDFAYSKVLWLVTNFDKMNGMDCLRYALTANMLSIYLMKHTSFSELWNTAEYRDILRNKDEWQTLVSCLLMRHMGQLVCNGHAISDMEVLQPSDYSESYIREKESLLRNHLYLCLSSTRVFTAIFPKISLLNHSCDPNIRNSFDGQNLTIYATRPIAEGEQVFNCYGPHYKLMDRVDRQSALEQQYCFKCDCDKCATDDRSIDQYYQYVCPNDGCGGIIDSSAIEKQWWLHLKDKRMCNAIATKFLCSKCDQKLILNPNTLMAFSDQALNQEASGRRPLSITQDLLNYYFAVAKCLSKYHELKQWMMQQIFSIKIEDDENFASHAYLVIENFIATRERYGICSMEFVMATTYALKIIDIVQTDCSGKRDKSEQSKILKILNKTQMAKAWSILPESTQNYFKNYLKNISEK